jgi:hypothetical protein
MNKLALTKEKKRLYDIEYRGKNEFKIKEHKKKYYNEIYKYKIYPHIAIAEKMLGRKLFPGEHVHHINGNHFDNRAENLLVCSRGLHSWLHRWKNCCRESKLTFDDVEEIRYLCSPSIRMRQKDVAQRYGVSSGYVCELVKSDKREVRQ